jgi:DNA-binding beta-propeller fold protein YncE
MAENTNIPLVEVIPQQIVLELMHFRVFPVLRSTSAIYLSTGDVTANSSAPFWSYVTSFNDRLYYTNSERNEVECCDINGTILWTFTDTSVLKAPRSIDVDEYGNVYVVGTDSVNVIVISPDGKEHRQLLSKADRLDDPRALHYDRQTRQLLVANAARSAFSYSVDYQ